MKKGMIFSLYQEGKPTITVMAINNKDVVNLDNLETIKDIDFENEAGYIDIENVFEL